jgi:hypothetical protein
MSEELEELEEQRVELLKHLAGLGDFRAGSVTGFVRRCGKAGCHCSRSEGPGHGPTIRLTYKEGGKTVTQSLPDRKAVEKANREIAEFRRFQELSRKLVEVNAKICRQRPVDEREERVPASKKNFRKRSSRKLDRR